MTDLGPESIGTRLRVAREQSGLSLRQIADATKLTVRALDGLERERIAHLPGGIYRRAIVRAYAKEVGLDPEVMLRLFLDQYPDDLPAPPALPAKSAYNYDTLPPADERKRKPRVLQMVLSVFGALVPISAGVFYFSIGVGGADAPRHVADVTPARAADVWQPEIVPARDVRDVLPAHGRPVAVMITVTSRCDLQVIADGRQVLARKVKAGELLQLDLGSEVVLSGDDAGAVHFSINGRAGRRLGAAGSPLNVRIGREDYDSFLISPNE